LSADAADLAHNRAERVDPLCRISLQLPHLSLWTNDGNLLRPLLRRLPGLEDVAAASGRSFERRHKMIKHLLKMVWNRKRTNFFIILEIFISFLVLFAVVTFGVYYTHNYRQPLGFNYERIWDVNIHQQGNNTQADGAGPLVSAKQVFLAVREFDEVEGLAG